MTRVLLGPFVGVAGMVFVLSAQGQEKPKADPPREQVKEDAAEKARKRFYSGWLEIERLEEGVKITAPEKLGGREFAPEQTVGWGRRGEVSSWVDKPGPQIDTTTDPMRVNFFNRARTLEAAKKKNAFVIRDDEMMTVVLPCIFKFEDGNLVIANGDAWVEEKELKKGEDYLGRPKDFTSTKENKRTVVVMKPSAVYIQD